uniref:MENTAL domain-containing protein n=1 Tax=Plectus sambesii TaxID=2011161 RepID=A0A914XPU3_9BILA
MSAADADEDYDRLWEEYHHQSRIGKDRRRFLIVAVFDFCLVTLLWILYTVSKGGDWATVFKQETDFTNPDFFKTSLFDVTLAACARMIYLILFYAILRGEIPKRLVERSMSAFLINYVKALSAHVAEVNSGRN